MASRQTCGLQATGGRGMYVNLLIIVLLISCSYAECQMPRNRSYVILRLQKMLIWPGILEGGGNSDRMRDQLGFAIHLRGAYSPPVFRLCQKTHIVHLDFTVTACYRTKRKEPTGRTTGEHRTLPGVLVATRWFEYSYARQIASSLGHCSWSGSGRCKPARSVLGYLI